MIGIVRAALVSPAAPSQGTLQPSSESDPTGSAHGMLGPSSLTQPPAPPEKPPFEVSGEESRRAGL